MEAILIIITLILLTILGLILYKIMKKKNRKDRDDSALDSMLKDSGATIDGKPLGKGKQPDNMNSQLLQKNIPLKLVKNKYCDYEDSFTTSVDPNIVGDPKYIDYYSTECSCGTNRPCWKVKIFENGNFCSKRCDKYHEKIKNYP